MADVYAHARDVCRGIVDLPAPLLIGPGRSQFIAEAGFFASRRTDDRGHTGLRNRLPSLVLHDATDGHARFEPRFLRLRQRDGMMAVVPVQEQGHVPGFIQVQPQVANGDPRGPFDRRRALLAGCDPSLERLALAAKLPAHRDPIERLTGLCTEHAKGKTMTRSGLRGVLVGRGVRNARIRFGRLSRRGLIGACDRCGDRLLRRLLTEPDQGGRGPPRDQADGQECGCCHCELSEQHELEYLLTQSVCRRRNDPDGHRGIHGGDRGANGGFAPTWWYGGPRLAQQHRAQDRAVGFQPASGESAPESSTPLGQPGVNRPFAPVQLRGSLRLGHAFQVAVDDRETVLLGQAGDLLVQRR